MGGVTGCAPKSSSSVSGGATFTQTSNYNSNRQVVSTGSGSTTMTYSYNSLNYITSVTSPCANASAGNETTDFSYDGQGQLIKITQNRPLGCEMSGSKTFSLALTELIYSGSELYPSTLTLTYNSGVCTKTSNITFTKNSQNWISTIIEKMSSSGTASVYYDCTPGQSSQFTTSYTYDSNGNVLTRLNTTQGSSTVSTTTYTYDSSGRVTSITPPYQGGSGSITYTYNSAGQLTSSVTGSGSTASTTTYSY